MATESRKEKILNAALKLFCKQGFDGTSTRIIAKEAQVSESLIFRHFENKENLLQAVVKNGSQEVLESYESVLKLEHPKVIIKQIMSLPFTIAKEQYDFWKLLYSLRWHNKEANDEDILLPIKEKLILAFKALEYSEPKSEANAALLIFEGLMTTLLLKQHDFNNAFALFETVVKKYDV